MAKRRRRKKSLDVDVLSQINPNAAGVDVHSEELFVAVPRSRAGKPTRSFGTFTEDLREIADWLEACGIESVAMESTSVYWVPLYEMLEERGFEVYLVNARHLKNVPGRKTDVQDCEWIQQLHTYGLLRASFRPPEHIRAIRALVRHRDSLIRTRATYIQRMQKALDLMNVRLTNVLSDITGVTGMKIIRDIVAGERDPKVLASYRDTRCQRTEEEICKSLDGHYKREHVFSLRQCLRMYEFHDEQLRECDQELEALYKEFDPPHKSEDSVNQRPAPETGSRSKNAPYFDLTTQLYEAVGLDLTLVTGLNSLTVQAIISEIGVDVSAWPTSKHFASWVGVCPRKDMSAGRVKHHRKTKQQNRVNRALRLAAQALSRSDSYLGACSRAMRARHGPQVAVTIMAHKLARIVYHLLKYREDFVDPGADQYDEDHKQRVLRSLRRRAARLGYSLEERPLAQVT